MGDKLTKILYFNLAIILFAIPLVMSATQDRLYLRLQGSLLGKIFNKTDNTLVYFSKPLQNEQEFEDNDFHFKLKGFGFKKVVYRYSLDNDNNKKWIPQKDLSEPTMYSDMLSVPEYSYVDKFFIKTSYNVPDFTEIKLENYLDKNKVFNGKKMHRETQKTTHHGEIQDLDAYVYEKTTLSDQNTLYIDKFKIADGYLYNGKDIKQPELGDIKIAYSLILPQKLNFLGKVDSNNQLVPYIHHDRKIFYIKYNNKNEVELLKNSIIKDDVYATTITSCVFFVCLFLIVLIFKAQLGDAILKFPYFGEYFYFNNINKCFIICLLISVIAYLLLMSVHIPAVSIITILIFTFITKFIRNIDFYSI